MSGTSSTTPIKGDPSPHKDYERKYISLLDGIEQFAFSLLVEIKNAKQQYQADKLAEEQFRVMSINQDEGRDLMTGTPVKKGRVTKKT